MSSYGTYSNWDGVHVENVIECIDICSSSLIFYKDVYEDIIWNVFRHISNTNISKIVVEHSIFIADLLMFGSKFETLMNLMYIYHEITFVSKR